MLFFCCAVVTSVPLWSSVTGTITGPDGVPLPGIEVRAIRPLLPTSLAELRLARDIKPLAMATTNAEGLFKVETTGNGLVDLTVRADGYAPMDRMTPADDAVGTIRLVKAAAVQGHVTARGKPVAKATVIIASQSSFVVQSTDAAGSYRVADPVLWAQEIVVMHDDFATTLHPPATLDFQLDAGKQIEGMVVDAHDRPVAGAAVDVDRLVFATSAADGSFTLSHVPARSFILHARTADGIAVAAVVEGRPTLRLAPRAVVSGVVRDETKHPVSGVRIRMGDGLTMETSVTDATGAYAFDAVPRARFQLMADGSPLLAIDEMSIDATSGRARHDLLAKAIAPINGVVRDADGSPAAGASIIAVMTARNGFEGELPAQFVTARDGRFHVRLPLDSSVKMRLLAKRPGSPPAMAPLTTSREVEITIPAGEPLEVVVKSAAGKPIDGVHIEPTTSGASASQMAEEPASTEPAWGTTGQDGRFHGRLSAGPNLLRFAKNGYVSTRKTVEIGPAGKTVEITLIPTVEISGRIVDNKGKPVTEAFVAVANQFVMTAPDGSFTLGGMEPGPVMIRFGRTSPQEQSVNAPARDIVLVVAASRTIRGKVIDAATGAPVKAFVVTPLSDDGGERSRPFESATGEFEVEVNKALTLEVRAAGYVTRGEIDAAKSDPIVVALSHGREVRGHITDERGQPLEGVTVALPANTWGSDDGVGGQPLRSRADGSYEISGVPFEQDVDLSFVKESFVATRRKLTGGHDDATLDVTLLRGIAVTGRVINATGDGVPQVTVSASSAGHGTQSATAETDASGVFHFDGLARTRYDFSVQRTEQGEHGAVNDVNVEKIKEVIVRLQKKPTSTVVGKVLQIEEATGIAMVMVTSEDGEAQSGAVDASGNFSIVNAPAGMLAVQAMMTGPRGSRMSNKVTVQAAPNGETRVELSFAKQITVRGHVTRDGAPMASAAVSFSGATAGTSTAMTSQEGTYETALDPGEYTVSIRASGNRRLPFTQSITVSQSSQFDFRVDTATIAVTVVDAGTGLVLRDASVTASKPGQTHEVATSKSNSEGIASLEVIPGEPLTVVASAPGHANASENVTASSSTSLTLRLLNTAGVVVRIVDVRDGRTLTGYVIARDQSGGVIASSSDTTADGTTTLPLAPGDYQISASAEGFGSHTVAVKVPSPEVRVALPRGGTVAVRSPAIRGTARLIQPDGQQYVRCWCNGIATISIDGPSTLIDRVSPGVYTLEVVPTIGKARQFAVKVVEGETFTVTLD